MDKELSIKRYIEKNTLFYIAYFIFIFSSIVLEYSELSYYDNLDILRKILLLLIYALLMLKILIDNKSSIKYLLIIGSILSCFFLSYYFSGYSILFKVALLICAAKDIDFNKLIKFDIKIKTIFVMIVIGLCLFGVIPDYIFNRGTDEVLRHSLGFIHPNILAGLIMTLCFEWVYLRFYKMKIYDYLLVITLFGAIYFITDSRTSTIAVALFLILSIIFRYIPVVFEKVKIFKILTVLLAPLCTIISIIVCNKFTWSDPVLKAINEIFTGRIYQASVFIKKYGFFPLGQKIEMISYRDALADNVKAAIIDNAYINLGIIYGIVPLVLFCIALMLLSRKAIKDKNYPLLVTIITFTIYGFMETFVFKVTYNFSLIAISGIIYGINISGFKKRKTVKEYDNIDDKINKAYSKVENVNKGIEEVNEQIKITDKEAKKNNKYGKKIDKKIEKANRNIRKAKRLTKEAYNIIVELNDEISEIWY